MKEAATRTLLQNTVGPALKATVSNPSEIAALAGPLSDALKTCYCKEELKEVELRRVWCRLHLTPSRRSRNSWSC